MYVKVRYEEIFNLVFITITSTSLKQKDWRYRYCVFIYDLNLQSNEIIIYKYLYVECGALHVWFSFWCLTPLSTIFQLYRGGQF